MTDILYKFICGSLLLWSTSCESFLDEKPDISVSIPESIKDLRLMLDDASYINQAAPGFIEMGSDDYEVDYATFVARPVFDQQVYLRTGEPEFQLPDITLNWVQTYKTVLISHVVLEGLERIKEGISDERRAIEGEALFNRAFAYFMLAQIYADPYDPNTANSQPGLVVRPSSDFNEDSFRVSVSDSYRMIIEDLLRATELLPDVVSQRTRPCRQAALALLARVYLTMEDYEKALYYAERALAYGNDLIDFNSLSISTSNPFKPMDKEVIFHAICNSGSLLTRSRCFVPKELYESYGGDDLRKSIFFTPKNDGNFVYKASYSGSTVLVFVGLAVDELFFIKAESEARLGQQDLALETVNQLLRSRWREGTYTNFETADPTEALAFILKERRKGLLCRGLRWSDLRRLNRDERFKVTLSRRFEEQGIESLLPPNDSRYTYLIPAEVIEKTGVPQNSR